MRTLNVWRQLIAVVRHLVYPGASNPVYRVADWENETWFKAIWGAQTPAPQALEAAVNAAIKDAVPTMEAHGRTWHKGPPPHVGWWNASVNPTHVVALATWRWWDGKRWAKLRFSDLDSPGANDDGTPARIWWSDYYPEDAVVPRMTPEQWKEKACASA